MTDIIDDLEDLIRQATTERSHYYVASCAHRSIAEVKRLREALDTCRELREYDGRELMRLRAGIKADTLQELLHALVTDGVISPNTARKVQESVDAQKI